MIAFKIKIILVKEGIKMNIPIFPHFGFNLKNL